jgi:hypothetical protein
MADPKDVERPVFKPAPLPTREELLAENKEELVERAESLARELQQRMELEEEILHLNFQKGTASLQSQVEEASRRYRTAQQELEIFRAEILGAEEDPGRMAPRPFLFENLDEPSVSGSDPVQLRALMAVFRRLRDDRERLQREVDLGRGEVERLSKDLKEAQQASSPPSDQSGPLLERVADLERRLEETFRQTAPEAALPDGYELLQKFFQTIGLKELLEKQVPGQPRPDRISPAGMLLETIGAIIAAQDRALEAAKELPFKIVRPPRKPELAELRQFIEQLPVAASRGFGRVQDLLWSTLTALPGKQEELTIDVDSLEGVIDSKPHPHQSFWSLVCFASELREFWQGKLLFSSLLAPRDIVNFVSGCISKASLRKSHLRFRMDARFFSAAILRLLDAKRCSYVIATPDSPDLRGDARICDFSEISDGWEAGECRRRIRSTQVRFVVLRHPLYAEMRPVLPFLFRDPHYSYQVFAVDKKISPWQALQCYAGRAEAEEIERSLLRDFCVNRLLGRGRRSHANCFPIYLFASNLLRWWGSAGGLPGPVWRAGKPVHRQLD